ncbi:oligosaccharide MFS transporter [Saccharopolyspora sp. NPDC002686]|uniref:oligosaccharide MFS transporter n=1 Tax=Saccharopolyspora sp. NPDC002686 TaxID=3154541 RepID=UPI00333251FD
MERTLKNGSYLQSSVTLLLFFSSWGVWWSFFQIWLTDEENGLGLSGSEVGTVYAANSLATLVIMFAYGAVQDRLGTRRHLTILASAAMTLVGPFFVFVYQPLLSNAFALGVVVGAVFLSLGFMAAVGLFEAVSERLSRTYGFEYGQSRMWGSFGYALLTLAAGFLFTVDPTLNFALGSFFGLLCLLTQLFWASPRTTATGTTGSGKPTVPSAREMMRLLQQGRLWLIIVLVFFTWTFYTVYDQQMFPDFYAGLFASQAQGQEAYGVLNAVQVFTEAAMLGVIPILMRKVGVRNTLLLGVAVMFVRILGSAVFMDPILVSAVKMLHSIEVPLFILGIFRYFTLHFNSALSATVYMVGFQISAQVGNVVLSQPLGALRDAIGYQPTFYVISGAVACAAVYAYFVLQRDDQDVQGDPFVRDGARAASAAR